jgi:hypothetical protein
MSNPRVAHCLFCDDVRHEVGNKTSLMGMYFSDLYIQTPAPIVLPKFCIAIWLITDVDDPPTQFTVRLLTPPNGTELFKLEGQGAIPAVPTEGAVKLIATMIIPISQFVLEQDGYIEVMLDTDRGSIRAGRLMVHFNAPPLEMASPAETQQSIASPTDEPQPS